MNPYISIGLMAILIANYLQIAEEWKQRGLTDTSYRVMFLLAVGPGCAAYGFDLEALPWHTLAYAGFTFLALAMIYAKTRDRLASRYRLVR